MGESFSTFLVWSGSLQLGDTPGPFADAMYTGLLLSKKSELCFIMVVGSALKTRLS